MAFTALTFNDTDWKPSRITQRQRGYALHIHIILNQICAENNQEYLSYTRLDSNLGAANHLHNRSLPFLLFLRK